MQKMDRSSSGFIMGMKKMELIMSVLQVVLAMIAIICAIYIPIRIMNFQRYTNLSTTYMGFDFAHAIQSVIEFFYKDCECDVDRIPEEYNKRFCSDFEKLKAKKIEKEDVLHYQRRMLTDYFYELESCRASSFRLSKMIKKDWTTSEAYVSRILICMNKAVDDNPDIMMDISNIKHQHVPKVNGISEYLNRLYNELKNEKKWMQIR